MGFPTAAGVPSFSGTYIPEIWSGKFQQKFYDGTCLSDVANTDWEGEIKKQGDKVHIKVVPSVTVRNYVTGQDLIYEDLTTTEVTLTVDKGVYFGFNAHLVNVRQSDVDFVNKFSEDASNQMKINIETGVWANTYADADASNKGATAGRISGDINLGVSGTPLVLDADNILDTLVDVGTVLDEQGVPENDRWIIIPSRAAGLIKKSDLRSANFSGDTSNDALRKGRIGMIDNFTIYSSNLLARVTDGAYRPYHMIAGHKSALTFAMQITENEKIKNPKGFGDIIRGLAVYGYETINGKGLVDIYARI